MFTLDKLSCVQTAQSNLGQKEVESSSSKCVRCWFSSQGSCKCEERTGGAWFSLDRLLRKDPLSHNGGWQRDIECSSVPLALSLAEYKITHGKV